jgi:streptogrisin C
MDRRLRSTIFVAALMTGLATAPTAAAATDGLLAAVQRDLGLTAGQAVARLAAERHANDTNLVLRKELGTAYGGGWLADGELVVGVTSGPAAAEVRASGATAKVVAHSEAALETVRSALDRARASAPRTVPGWYVDVRANRVVVLSRAAAKDAAWRFVRAAGVPAGAVRVAASDEAPRPLIDVVGGNAYYIGSGTRCSVGFSVGGGFVTAGHCGRTGATTTQPSGRFAGSSFPGNDYAYVQVGAGNTPVGAVNDYAGGRVAVSGSQDAAVGSTVCRSGSTTGWHCGTIQARNASVTYPEGTITGLIRTNVCAEPGDSGGSLVAGTQAQGVTSGGSGNCSSGGTTYFQPVNEILQAYGLTLVTSGGGPGPGCQGSLTGSLTAGGSAIQPNNSYYQSTASGAHTGCLDGPSDADFDLYLQKWNGTTWADVASATSPAPDETLTYTGSAGYYRYRVHAYTGSGTYTLGYTKP